MPKYIDHAGAQIYALRHDLNTTGSIFLYSVFLYKRRKGIQILLQHPEKFLCMIAVICRMVKVSGHGHFNPSVFLLIFSHCDEWDVALTA